MEGQQDGNDDAIRPGAGDAAAGGPIEDTSPKPNMSATDDHDDHVVGDDDPATAARQTRSTRRHQRRQQRNDDDETGHHHDDGAEDMYYHSQHSQAPLKCLIVVGVLVIVLLIGLIIAVAVTLSGSRGNDDAVTIDVPGISGSTPPPTGPPVSPQPPLDAAPALQDSSPRLRAILERGHVNCGIPEQPGFAVWNLTEQRYEGLDADLCRAVAAAVFGDPDNVDSYIRFTVLDSFNRFVELNNGNVDMLARTTTYTMEREVKERTTGAGFDFSIPYLYNGLQFAGEPSFVQCADGASLSGSCNATKICVLDGTTHVNEVQRIFEGQDISIVSVVSSRLLYKSFNDGFCNVIAGEQYDITASVAKANGVVTEYEQSDKVHSKEPLCLVSRDDDPVWSDFLNWVIQGLLAAEEALITQRTATAILPIIDVLGVQHGHFVRNAVLAVGNFGEIFQRHLQPILPRPVGDRINEGTTGVLYGFPFGTLTAQGGPRPGGTLELVRDRGFLKCGISNRAIFARFDAASQTWSGFDVDFCKALSAAIFDGITDTVEYLDLSASDRFFALQNGTVDVLSRLTTHTLSRDIYERDTKVGFSFSQPNFYDGLSFGGIPPFVDCADNLDVSSNDCQSLKICVNRDTTFEARIKTLFPERFVQIRDTDDKSINSLADGACNVFAGGVVDVAVTAVRETGYDGPYRSGSNRYSKDPLAMVTRQDDPQWSSLVFWVVSATFYAEEQGIQQTDFARMPQVGLFGPEMTDMFRNVIKTVGSYADIYGRNAEAELPRGGLNKVNFLLEGPQHYPLPGVLK